MNDRPTTYDRPAVPRDGLRLHFNENTSGCSPVAVAAVRALTAQDLARYPESDEARRACARAHGAEVSQTLLTNGLDEGILLAAVAALVAPAAQDAGEAIIPEPSYNLYRTFLGALGVRVVTAGPRADLSFPLDELLRQIGPATRLVFLSTPGNPTGEALALRDIEAVSGRLPTDGLIFVDAAYAEFGGEDPTRLALVDPRVLVGRTFSKAHGLAGVRLGVVFGCGPGFERLRALVPPYTINAASVAAVQAALEDPGHVERYRSAVAESRRAIYAACDRLRIEYWRSEANFVLLRVGDRARQLVARLAARGIHIRDRSSVPGCAGCVRVTAGWPAQTANFVSALEELWHDEA